MRTIAPIIIALEEALEAAALLAERTLRAWRYYRRLNYSWRLAWAKAGWQCGGLR